MLNDDVTKKINIACLLAAIAMVLFLPLRKEIWYDETVSILCSKGISHDTPAQFQKDTVLQSATINRLNTEANVFNATVIDNANGFLFNTALHWFTALFGNSISIYTLLSQLCGAAALVALYFLCTLVFGNGIFTSVTLILMATDNTFMGMAHEIRAYAMGVLLVVIAALYYYKFTYIDEKPVYLFLTGLFSVAAILCHFLSVYIVVAFLAGMLIEKKRRLFSSRNIIAIAIPVILAGLFFWISRAGFATMSAQNQQIQQRTLNENFSAAVVLLRSMKFTAINFKIVFPAFYGAIPITSLSFLTMILIFTAAVRAAEDKTERRNLYMLFSLGFIGSLFLAFLALKSHHYTALYFRYFAFCIPFCSLFMAYSLSVFSKASFLHPLIKAGMFAIVLLPSCILFAKTIANHNPIVKYNHAAIANKIVAGKINRIGVPEWHDALLVQCFLPKDYKADYVLTPTLPNFTLFNGTTVETVPVIKNNL